MSISRRNFVAGAAAMGVASAAMGATAATAEEAVFEGTVEWDAEYDVVVVGFGGAGANTAVAAADEGARVLLLEKAPESEAGGNSIVCVQIMCAIDDPEAFITYQKNLRNGWESPSDAIIETYAYGCAENEDWLVHLGADRDQITYNARAEYPLEGGDKFTYCTVHPMNSDGAAYKLFKNAVNARENIDVWYEAPAVKLIQDPATKIIHGVVAEVEGRQVNVRARNGVVLTLGGFENSPRYQQDYLGHKFWPSLGHAIYNEGDGIRMAIEVGADLWHMANSELNTIEFVEPDTLDCTWKYDGAMKGILVGSNGERFINEYDHGGKTHGHMNFGGTWALPVLPDECWEIGDAARFNAGPLYKTWSPDNSAEVAKGYITVADTLEGLAEAIGLDAAASEQLVATVADWNHFCEIGRDYKFEVAAEKLVPIAEGPYYAVKLNHACVNTQGGPVKNERGEVLNPQGEPIPHLYEAGEFGDIWSDLYQASCNLGGGLIFGRISGRNAAAPKDDVWQGSVMEGKEPFVPAKAEEPVWEAGENQFIGSADGKFGPVVVRVTKEGDDITQVEILQSWETEFLTSAAVEKVCADIAELDTPDVDVCAGASVTCMAISNAVRNALA